MTLSTIERGRVADRGCLCGNLVRKYSFADDRER